MTDFRDAFSEFEVELFEITNVQIIGDRAQVVFSARYSAFIEGSDEKIEYAGKGAVSFINEFGYWNICKIDFPGLVF